MRRAWINRKAEQPLSHQAGRAGVPRPDGQYGRAPGRAGGPGRGLRVGAAEVSDRNANYIVAQPGTTAADVIALAEKMRAGVRDTHGVELDQELKVW